LIELLTLILELL